jgi:hypothetical protein
MTPRPGLSVENATAVDMTLDRLADERAATRLTIDDTFLEFLESQPDELYFIAYRHPVLPRKNWLRQASGEETRHYLAQNIFPHRGDGLDLFVAPEDFRFLLMFSHDGDVVLFPAPADE